MQKKKDYKKKRVNFKQAQRNIKANFSPDLDLYLNNASRTPIPIGHQKILNDYLENWAQGEHDPYFYNFNHADDLKVQLGQFIHCSPDLIAIGTNVADSFANILYGVQWNNGDEIILLNDDYPSVTVPFQSKKDITIQWLNPQNGNINVDDIQSKLTKKTKAIALSWVNYTTGQINPIQEISDFCKQNEVLLFVDATQALGVLPISLNDVHIDFFVASLYKWCFSTQGTAIRVFSESFLNKIVPISAGVFSQNDRSLKPFPYEPSPSARKLEYGNLNILGIMLAHETFTWFNNLGIQVIHSILSDLSNQLILLLDRDFEFPVQYDPQNLSSIVSFIHPNPHDFMNRLTKKGGKATYRHDVVRLSPGIYQNQNTIDYLAELL